MKKILILLFLFSFPLSVCSLAQQKTLVTLVNKCTLAMQASDSHATNKSMYLDQTQSMDVGECLGYVSGFLDAANSIKTRLNGKYYKFLFNNNNTSLQQVIKPFLSFVHSHPADVAAGESPTTELGVSMLDSGLASFVPD